MYERNEFNEISPPPAFAHPPSFVYFVYFVYFVRGGPWVI
jgi:hypothetical protein